MNEKYARSLSASLNIPARQVAATGVLIAEGATVPFIARYRKEVTGQLDEVQIAAIRDGFERLADLDSRKQAILKSLDERELLTDKLKQAVTGADDLSTLEDIYMPYKPKRRTRAGIAREKGLEPLADAIFKQDQNADPEKDAKAFVNQELDVSDAGEALAGARDIMAEWINEDAGARAEIRKLYEQKADVGSTVRRGAKEKGAKFRDYFDWKEGAGDAPGHRMLAMFRGEKEGILTLRIRPPEQDALDLLRRRFVKSGSAASKQVELAAEDSYKRLTSLSMEVEYRMQLRERCDTEAIGVFASNLRELLMSAPLGEKTVLALDPAYRTGCKTVCLDKQGKLLINTARNFSKSS